MQMADGYRQIDFLCDMAELGPWSTQRLDHLARQLRQTGFWTKPGSGCGSIKTTPAEVAVGLIALATNASGHALPQTIHTYEELPLQVGAGLPTFGAALRAVLSTLPGEGDQPALYVGISHQVGGFMGLKSGLEPVFWGESKTPLTSPCVISCTITGSLLGQLALELSDQQSHTATWGSIPVADLANHLPAAPSSSEIH
jgi:hypothetical protein